MVQDRAMFTMADQSEVVMVHRAVPFSMTINKH